MMDVKDGGVDSALHITPYIEEKPPIGPKSNSELYTDPFDLPNYEELNIFELKTRLQKSRQLALSEEQKKKNLQGKEGTPQTDLKQLEQECKWRGIFEATFRELSQRGDKEGQKRKRNQGASEYLSVTTENIDDETLRQNSAEIPPLHTSNSDISANSLTPRSLVHDNFAEKEKRRIRDFEASWSEQDIDKFKSRFSIVGKNFANIARFFPEKTVKDCVECYYLIIKRYSPEYKNYVPKPMQTRKYRPPAMPTIAALAVYQQNGNLDASLFGFSNAIRCYKCQQVIDDTRDSMRVTRGLVDPDSDDMRDADVQRICTNCYNEEIQRRVEQKHTTLKKDKPAKNLAARWKKLNAGQKALLRREIARDITFACTSCNKKLLERVDMLFTNHNTEGDVVCCQRHYPGGNQLKLTAGRSLNNILLENIDKFLYEVWHSEQVRDYKVPKRSHIAVSLPFAKVLNENDVDVVFEHCLNFVRLYEPECGSLPAVDLVSSILFPEVIIRSVMVERGLNHDDAYVALLAEDNEKERPSDQDMASVLNEIYGKTEPIANQETLVSDCEEMIDVEAL